MQSISRRIYMRKNQSKICELVQRLKLPTIEIEPGIIHPVHGWGLLDVCALIAVPSHEIESALFWVNRGLGFGRPHSPSESQIALATQCLSEIDLTGPFRWCDDFDLSNQFRLQCGACIVSSFRLGIPVKYRDDSLFDIQIRLPLRFANSLRHNALTDVAR